MVIVHTEVAHRCALRACTSRVVVIQLDEIAFFPPRNVLGKRDVGTVRIRPLGPNGTPVSVDPPVSSETCPRESQIKLDAVSARTINLDFLGFDILPVQEKYMYEASLFEDSMEFLKKAEDDKIVLTDTFPTLLDMKLQYFGIGKYFRSVYSTFTFGYPKADARAFDIVLNDENIEKEDIIFVDDNPSNVQTAIDFGIKSSYLFKRRAHHFKDERPELPVIESLNDLLVK